mmetsp:Transcript_4324/g.8674  ORF Transcript_4324/g.8674 Transcript_4324/m.8674 type:complete len:89 (+) Transcript_4324:623-889(+)
MRTIANGTATALARQGNPAPSPIACQAATPPKAETRLPTTQFHGWESGAVGAANKSTDCKNKHSSAVIGKFWDTAHLSPKGSHNEYVC